ncbi:MAG: GNAT family N-acetyltransferase [Verrucomicrobia bacterium]|nr:GNAT family N-acetyltransferase [Verrucomicrobiota bacterium]
MPRHRPRAFDLFERFAKASRADSFEVQTNGELLTVMLHTYGGDLESEKVVFRDQVTTALPSPGAVLRRTNSLKESRDHFQRRDGSSEWSLELEGAIVATGGIAFHYNPPYGDLYMHVAEPFRRRGLGAYLVQELKRVAYELGCVPGARCDPANLASRRTLLRAGFAPCGHILIGSLNLRASSAPFAPSTPRG